MTHEVHLALIKKGLYSATGAHHLSFLYENQEGDLLSPLFHKNLSGIRCKVKQITALKYART